MFRSYAMAVLYGVVTYMTPLATIGVFSNEPSLAMPVWKTMRGTSWDTLAVVMVFRLRVPLIPVVAAVRRPVAAALCGSRAGDGQKHRGQPPTRTDPHGHSPQGQGQSTWPCRLAAGEARLVYRWARLGCGKEIRSHGHDGGDGNRGEASAHRGAPISSAGSKSLTGYNLTTPLVASSPRTDTVGHTYVA